MFQQHPYVLRALVADRKPSSAGRPAPAVRPGPRAGAPASALSGSTDDRTSTTSTSHQQGTTTMTVHPIPIKALVDVHQQELHRSSRTARTGRHAVRRRSRPRRSP